MTQMSDAAYRKFLERHQADRSDDERDRVLAKALDENSKLLSTLQRQQVVLDAAVTARDDFRDLARRLETVNADLTTGLAKALAIARELQEEHAGGPR